MMQSLKYGFVIALGYTFVIAAMCAILSWADMLFGKCSFETFFTSTYLVFFAVAFVISFIAGFCFPLFLSRFIIEYSKEYPDVPEKYIYDICRGKLLMKYFQKLACISFVLAVPLFLFLPEEYGSIYIITICSGFTFLNLYFKYKKKYNDF